MKRNIGIIDRFFRIIVAALMAILYFTDTFRGTWGTPLIVIAGILLLTSLVGFAPLYALLGINTCSEIQSR